MHIRHKLYIHACIGLVVEKKMTVFKAVVYLLVEKAFSHMAKNARGRYNINQFLTAVG